jgi:tRNA C32,U32 (ribose-2'-O)-methylase TrmJ
MSDADFSRRMTADPTRFVLVGTSHAGNVGAAARAMKVMGFSDLVLVAPRFADVHSARRRSRWRAARPTCSRARASSPASTTRSTA